MNNQKLLKRNNKKSEKKGVFQRITLVAAIVMMAVTAVFTAQFLGGTKDTYAALSNWRETTVFDASESITLGNNGYYYIEAWGGNGGKGGGITATPGGNGGVSQKVAGLFYFPKDTVLNLYVGSAGASNNDNVSSTYSGGTNGSSFGGGGTGATGGSAGTAGRAGGGGGAGTFVLLNGTDVSNSILVSGGGGGGGGRARNDRGGDGGNGGAANAAGGNGAGNDNSPAANGTGGTTAQSSNTIGTNGTSGEPAGTLVLYGGGGGGGGGGGYTRGGGGGSGGSAGSLQSTVSSGAGGKGGNGYLSGTVATTPAGISLSTSDRTSGENGQIFITFHGIPTNVLLNQNGGGTAALSGLNGTSGINSSPISFNTARRQILANLTTLPTRPGYTFQGYYDTAAQTGGTMYINSSGTGLEWDKDSGLTDGEGDYSSPYYYHTTTIYARWSARSYTVNYSAPEATAGVPGSNSGVTWDTTDFITGLSTPTRGDGYIFDGWYYVPAYPGGNTTEIKIDSTTRYRNLVAHDGFLTSDTSMRQVTLYAKWRLAGPLIIAPSDTSKTYDGTGFSSLKWEVSHLAAASGISVKYEYVWEYSPLATGSADGPWTEYVTGFTTLSAVDPTDILFPQTVVNVSQSGWYRLGVRTIDVDGLTSGTEYLYVTGGQGVRVEITPQKILPGNVTINGPILYDDSPHTAVITVKDAQNRILDEGLNTYKINTEFTSYTLVGSYPYDIVFCGNYCADPDPDSNADNTMTRYFVIMSSTAKISFDTRGKGAELDPVDSELDDVNKIYPVMPEPSNVPAGYKFNGWMYFDGNDYIPVEAGDVLLNQNNHTLYADYVLADATINMSADIDRAYSRGTASNITYSWTHSLTAGGATLTAQWYKATIPASGNEGDAVWSVAAAPPSAFTDVADSVWYKVEITTAYTDTEVNPAWNLGTLSSTATRILKINIRPKTLTSADIKFTPDSPQEFTGSQFNPTISITDGAYTLLGSEYTITPPDETIQAVGLYPYAIDWTENGNYTGPALVNFIIINTAQVTFTNLKGATPLSSIGLSDGKFQSLPTTLANAPAGYTFLGWSTVRNNISTKVIDGDTAPAGTGGIITLYALWEFDQSYIDSPAEGAGLGSISITRSGKPLAEISVDRDYEHGLIDKLTFTASTTFSGTYQYLFEKSNGAGGWAAAQGIDNVFDITNVKESGVYRVTVTFTDSTALMISRTYTFGNVIINPLKITSSLITLSPASGEAGGIYNVGITVKDENNFVLLKGSDYTYTPDPADFSEVGTHIITFTFDSAALSGNYTKGEETVSKTFAVFSNAIISLRNMKGYPTGGSYKATTANRYPIVSLPVPTAEGYVFLGWSQFAQDHENHNVLITADTEVLADDHNIYAVWKFDEDQYIDNTQEGAGLGRVSVTGINVVGTGVSREYQYNVFNSLSFVSNSAFSAAALEYKYEKKINGDWEVIPAGEDGFSLSFLRVTNFADSGLYRVTVRMSEAGMDFVERTYEYDIVTITKQVLSESNITVASEICLDALDGHDHNDPEIYVTDKFGRILTRDDNGKADYSVILNGDNTIPHGENDYPVFIDFGENGNYRIPAGNGFENSITVSFLISEDEIKITFANYKGMKLLDSMTLKAYVDIPVVPNGENTFYPRLPILESIPYGYKFLGWSTDGTENGIVREGYQIDPLTNVVLYGVWEFDGAFIDYPIVGGNLGSISITGTGVSVGAIGFTREYQYGANNYLTFTIGNVFSGPQAAGIIFSYKFEKQTGPDSWADVTVDEGFNYFLLTDVSQSGFYRLTVTISEPGITGELNKTYLFNEVTITYQAVDNIVVRSAKYDGTVKQPESLITLTDGQGHTLSFGNDYTIVSLDEIKEAGFYSVTIQLKQDKNYKFADGTYTKDVTIVVNAEAAITFTGYKTAALSTLPTVSVSPYGNQYPELPGLIGIPSGYVFLGWSADGTEAGIVNPGDEITITGDHVLIAVWAFDEEITKDTMLGQQSGDIEREYQYSVTDYLEFALLFNPDPAKATKSFVWSYSKTGVGYIAIPDGLTASELYDGTLARLSGLTNVAHSGYYKLTVTISEDSIGSVTAEYVFYVDITAKTLTADNIILPGQSWTGNALTPVISVIDGGHTLLAAEFGYTLQTASQALLTDGNFVNAGSYKFDFEFFGNYTGTAVKDFVIIYDSITITLTGKGITSSTTVEPTADRKYKDLPALTADGYTFEGWYLGNQEAVNGATVIAHSDHTLTARWTLKDPLVAPNISLNGGNNTNLTKEYEIGIKYELSAAPFVYADFETDGGSFVYEWWYRKTTTDTYTYLGNMSTIEVINVSDSGQYKLVIRATDNSGLQSSAEHTFNVSLTAKDMSDNDFIIAAKAYTGSGLSPDIVIKDGSYALQYGVDYRINGITWPGLFTRTNMGNYALTIEFIGNYEGSADRTFTITRVMITYIDPLGEEVELGATDDGKYPAIASPVMDGYTFDYWERDGVRIIPGTTTLRVLTSHEITAHWTLNTPIAAGTEQWINDNKTNAVSETYDKDTIYTLKVIPAHDAEGVTYVYEWRYRKASSGSYNTILSSTDDYYDTVYNVSHSGYYMVSVVATANGYTSAPMYLYFTVNIMPKPLTADDVTIAQKDFTGSGVSPTIMVKDGDYALTYGTEYTIAGFSYPYLPVYTEMGSYYIRIQFPAGGNYTSIVTIEKEFIINQLYVKYINPLGADSAWMEATAGGIYPSIANPTRAGYTFMGWYYEGALVVPGTTGLIVLTNHTVIAAWKLNAPELLNSAYGEDANALIATYNDSQSYTLTATIDLASGAAENGVEIVSAWSRFNGTDWISLATVTGFALNVENVADNGLYKLTVYAIDRNNGYTSTIAEHIFEVNISPKEIAAEDIQIPSQKWMGGSEIYPTIRILDGLLIYGIDFLTSPDNLMYAYTDMGTYDIIVFFPQNGNYIGKAADCTEYDGYYGILKTFTISGIMISFETGGKGEAIEPLSATTDGKYPLDMPQPHEEGYVFAGWKFNDTWVWTVNDGFVGSRNLLSDGNHPLVAVWQLIAPTLSDKTYGTGDNGALALSEIYDRAKITDPYVLTLTANHPSKNSSIATFSLVYEWSYSTALSGTYVSRPDITGDAFGVYNVSHSGYYKLTVYAYDSHEDIRSAKVEHIFYVNIAPKEIAADDIIIPDQPWNGGTAIVPSITVKDGGYTLVYGSDYSTNPASGTGFTDMGAHTIVFIFPENGNYTGKEEDYGTHNGYYGILKTFTVSDIMISFDTGGKGEATAKAATAEGTYPSLPVLTAAGYSFVGWKFNDSFIWTSEDGFISGGNLRVNANHMLIAVWELKAPALTLVNDGFTKEYDMLTQTLEATASLEAGAAAAGIEVVYVWSYSKTQNGAYSNIADASGSAYSITNVIQSGYYKLTAYAIDGDVVSTAVTYSFTVVDITPKTIAITDFDIPLADYTGLAQSPAVVIMHGSYKLVYGKDYTTNPIESTQFANMGAHTIDFEFTGNYSGAFSKDFVIRIISISFVGTKSVTVSNMQVTADGKYPVLPAPSGVKGYVFEKWQYNAEDVGAGELIRFFGDHALTAVWKLGSDNIPQYDPLNPNDPNHPDNPNNTETGGSGIYGFYREKSLDINRVYEYNKIDVLSVKITHKELGDAITYSYQWWYSETREGTYRILDGQTAGVLNITNVIQSGWYEVRVVAKDTDGLSIIFPAYRYEVKITPKTLGVSALTMPAQVYTGGGLKPEITIKDINSKGEEYILVVDVDYTVTPAYGTEYKKTGSYTLTFTLIGNYSGTFDAQFVIKSSDSIVSAWWLWVIIGAAVVAIAFILWMIWLHIRNKRRKYGMKRRVSSFLDDFDKS